MKRVGPIVAILTLFAVSLFVAYQQSINFADSSAWVTSQAISSFADSQFVGFWTSFFANILSSLTSVFADSLLAAIMVLALMVELITLYPAASIQLKQKKIHLDLHSDQFLKDNQGKSVHYCATY